MCNLYNFSRSQEEVQRLFPNRQWQDRAGKAQPGDIYPDRMGPVVHTEGEGLVLRQARWGLPSLPQFHSKNGIDRGVTNLRNKGSPH